MGQAGWLYQVVHKEVALYIVGVVLYGDLDHILDASKEQLVPVEGDELEGTDAGDNIDLLHLV